MSYHGSTTTGHATTAPPLPFPMPPRLADELGLTGVVVDGRYLIEEPVGCGGFGVVYRARHLRFDAAVALKVLRVPQSLAAERRQAFIDRLLWEGKLLFELAQLHPCIVRVLEVGSVATAQGVTGYLAMEWLDGMSLAQDLSLRAASKRRSRSITEVLSLLEPLSAGLALAHQHQVIHRDIKPANIFLTRDGSLKLVDFGLAKVLPGPSTAPRAAEGEPGAFTRAYAAPEQWRPALGPLGPGTDVFALALVCVELLTGARALDAEDADELRAACLDEARRPTPRRRGAAVSDEVERVFARALAVNPRARFDDVPSFWSAFAHAARVSPRARRWRAGYGGLAFVLLVILALGAGREEAPSVPMLPPEPSPTEPLPSAPLIDASTVTSKPSVWPELRSQPAPRRSSGVASRRAQPVAAPTSSFALEPAVSATPPPPPLERLFHHDELSRRK